MGTESLSPSAEPEAQLEEQVGKTQGGGLGRGPALPTKGLHGESGWPQPPPEEGWSQCQLNASVFRGWGGCVACLCLLSKGS